VPPDTLTHVYLLTIGRGAKIWQKFGHSALWIHEPSRGGDMVYNWGVFDFRQKDFLEHLLSGHMLYGVDRTTLRRALAEYRSEGRAVFASRLRLDAEQTRRVLRGARIAVRAENRYYAYDPFTDNCATRIRDLLNRALLGKLRTRTAPVRTGTTYRSHTLRLLRDVWWAYLGVMVFLGSPTDGHLSGWQEMFLPFQLEHRLQTTRTEGERALPLAAPRDTLLAAAGGGVPGRGRAMSATLAIVGLAGGVGILGLAFLAARSRGRRLVLIFEGLVGLWSLLVGLTGALLVLGWLVTAHWYVHANTNVLQIEPLSAVLAVFLIGPFDGVRRRLVSLTAWIVLLASLTGFLLAVWHVSRQATGPVVALFLPVHAGVAGGLTLLAHERSSAEPRPSDGEGAEQLGDRSAESRFPEDLAGPREVRRIGEDRIVEGFAEGLHGAHQEEGYAAGQRPVPDVAARWGPSPVRGEATGGRRARRSEADGERTKKTSPYRRSRTQAERVPKVRTPGGGRR